MDETIIQFTDFSPVENALSIDVLQTICDDIKPLFKRNGNKAKAFKRLREEIAEKRENIATIEKNNGITDNLRDLKKELQRAETVYAGYEKILEEYRQEICDQLQKAVRRAEVMVVGEDEEEETGETAGRAPALQIFGNKSSLTIFDYFNGKLYTKGYCGVIKTTIEIKDDKGNIFKKVVRAEFQSRFDNGNSLFLMYIFEKAFNVKGNIFLELSPDADRANSWGDFLLMAVFFSQFRQAMKKGIYRQYQEFSYNDSKVKGRLDVDRHIKNNMLFGNLTTGNVSYVTREYTMDNDVNRLILRALESMKKRHRDVVRYFLDNNDSDHILKRSITMLQTEIEGWQSGSDRDLIKNADKKIVHNIYRDYENLRRTSIAIIKRMGANVFHKQDDTASGLLIEMSHLWEVFLHNMVFSAIFEDKKRPYKQASYDILFHENADKGMRIIKPDFLYEWGENRLVIDAKYKEHWERAYVAADRLTTAEQRKGWQGTREDVFQVISYMHMFNCKYGGFMFPHSFKWNGGKEDLEAKMQENAIIKYSVRKEMGFGSSVYPADEYLLLVPIEIPLNDAMNLDDFREYMDQSIESVGRSLREEIV